MKKFIRITGYSILAVLGLLVVIAVLLLLPPVQTFIAQKATKLLAEQTGGKISIGKVAIRLPDAVRLKDIYIQDLNNDTMLYTGTLNVNISIFGLLQKQVEIDNVLLEDGVVRLHQDPQDSTFNFQFLIDAFTSDTLPKDTAASAWTVTVNAVELNRVRADVDAPAAGFRITGVIGEFTADADEFNLEEQRLEFGIVRLINSNVAITLLAGDTALADVKDTLIADSAQRFLIPAIGWAFKAGKIDFDANQISFDDLGKEPLPKGLDFSHLNFDSLNIQITGAVYEGNTVKADVQNISALEKSGLHLKALKGNVTLDSSSIILDQFSATTNNSRVASSISLRFADFIALKEFSKDVSVNADFKETTISAKDVLLFVPQLAETESFNFNAINTLSLDGAISGTIGDLTGKDFIFALDDGANAHLNFSAKGLPDIDNAYFTLNIDEFSATPALISSLIDTALPEQVMRLGRTSLTGKYAGTIRKMDFNGVITTQIGNLAAQLKAAFNQAYTHASYEGTINLNDFQLGTLLADTTLGPVTLEATLQGSGLTIDSLQADLKATIKAAAYRDYNYNDIAIDGNLDKKKFTGRINIDDENLKFDFNGLVDFNDTVPTFEFDAMLDTVNLGALNLVENNMGIHAEIAVDFRGLSIDAFSGRGAIRNINISTDSVKLSLDSVTATAYEEGVNNKILELASPVVNARIAGDFNAADLPRLLINYVNDYFPLNMAVDSTDRPPNLAIEPDRPAIPDQKFEMLITVSKPLKLLQLFLPQFTQWDTAAVAGNFDSKAKSLQLNASIPGLEYGTFRIDSATLVASGDNNDLEISAHIYEANLSDKLSIPHTELSSIMADDNMDVSIVIGGDSLKRLGIGARVVRKEDQALRINIRDSVQINSARWFIPADNFIEYNTNYLHFHNVRLQHDGQELALSSPKDTAGVSLDIGFKDFKLHEISDFADYNKIKLDGNINGSVLLQDIYTQPSFLANLKIDNIIANDNPVGDLTLKASQQQEAILVNLNLAGGENRLSVAGNLFPEKGTLDFKLDMQRLNLNAADAFLPDYISESKGFLSADLTIKGAFTQPEINGELSFHDISTKSVFANTRFTIPDNTVGITPNRININRMQILDEKNRTATVNGSLAHKNFQDIELDLTLNTNEFMFLKTASTKTGFFYGDIVLAINGSIRGPVSLPVVNARASTKPGTKVFIAPMAMESEIKRENFVIFRSPPYDTIQNIDSLTVMLPEYQVNMSGVDLNLEFELTPDAQVKIVLDQVYGDSLICYGRANLIVDIPPLSTPQITGAYIVEKGSYFFSYQKLLRRNFSINKDSRIDFSGNIMSARMDITAQYTANATTFDLISAQSASLSASEIDAAKRRSPVYVLLKIKGELAQPEMTFDIQMPADQSNLVSSTVARKLSLMRENPTELNKQVFALLMFNNFMAEEGSDPDLESAGENVALRSVSNLISNQFNRLANRIEGFEVNLDLSSYKSKYETQEGNDVLTEVGLDVSKEFFKNRLIVTVGGNVNVENATSGQSKTSGLSNVTGDFTIEYKLTESGRYRVKVYQTSDFDILDQSNVYRTGVGVTYRESFRKLIKKKPKQSTTP